MIGGAYILVVLGTVFAKAIGFMRNLVFASAFGTSATADNYNQIFGLVTFIFTGIGVALSTLLIKNLNKEENSGEERQKAYVGSFLRKTLLYLIAATALMYALARPLTHLVLPNVTGASFREALTLMRIMIPSMASVIIAYIISGVLQNNRVFFITSIMSLPFNVLIIMTLLVPDVSIYWVGIATTVGWFLHIIIQLPAFYKKGYSFTYRSADETVCKKGAVSYEALYIFISNMMFQLCFIIDKAFASGGDGKTATLGYASELFVTISSVFVVAMSTVVFPAISKNYEEGNMDYVRELIQYLFVIMMVIFIPYLLVVSFFGEPVIALLYERGKFTAESTHMTAKIFLIYSFGIFGYIAQDLFNKVLYLASKYVYTLIGTVMVVGINLIADLTLSRYTLWGIEASAVVTTVLLSAYAFNVAFALYKVLGKYWSRALLIRVGKILLSGAVAAAVFFVFRLVAPSLLSGKVTFLIPLAACGAMYIAALYVTGILRQLVQKVDRSEKEKSEAKEGA